MKKALLALLLACCLPLSGCSALLERPYSVVEPHTELPAAGEDPSVAKVGSYSKLVDAIYALVAQCAQEGMIQLVDYKPRDDVSTDLDNACKEVNQQDPLGAYAVEYIEYDHTPVLSTYEVYLSITYQRTPEQVRGLINVTGSSAIRSKVGDALAEFRPEVALRVGYFTEDEASISALVRQAYYDHPAAALGMPEFAVALYPGQSAPGSQRIVEITLTYPAEAEALRRKSGELSAAAESLTAPIRSRQYSASGRLTLLLALLPTAVKAEAAPGADGASRRTAWDALLGEGADSEGLALSVQLLADELELSCAVTEGTLDGQAHFWNTFTVGGETRHLDLTLQEEELQLHAGAELLELGFAWADAPEFIQADKAPAA